MEPTQYDIRHRGTESRIRKSQIPSAEKPWKVTLLPYIGCTALDGIVQTKQANLEFETAEEAESEVIRLVDLIVDVSESYHTLHANLSDAFS